MVIIRPLTKDSIDFLHDKVIKQDPNAEPGYSSESLIGVSMERAMSSYYGEIQYKGIFEKTSALIHGIITFHPFTDGNKRTALLAAYWFLLVHGYKFRIMREDILKTFVSIAKDEICDIEDISRWVEKNTKKMGLGRRFLLFLVRAKRKEIDIDFILTVGRIVSPFLQKIEDNWP